MRFLRRSPAPAALVALLAFSGAATSAEPVSEQATCQPSRGSVSFLSCSLARKLLPAALGAKVTVVDLKSDRELPAPDALRERVKSAVAAALRSTSTTSQGAEHGKLRVELAIEKSAGVLRVTAELRRATGLWQRVRHKQPSAEQHAFVEVALDAELRALIPPPPLVVSETIKIKAPERGIVAVACGPLGSDGGQELALVSRGNVRVGRIAAHGFSERKRVAWAALSPVAPAPLREPIASVEITEQGALRVGLSDRRDGLVLSRDLAILERYEGAWPVGGGCFWRSGLGVSSHLAPCDGKEAANSANALTLDALTATPRGWIGRDAATSTLSSSERGLVPSQTHVGAQLALADADNDGNFELAFSADTLEPGKDRLTLATLAAGKLTTRFTLPAPAIGALAICARREGPAMAPVLVATGDELWLLR
jgi:hypothetical protein